MWIDWADKQLGLRFIAKSLLDNESVMSSADFGLGALGNFTLPFMPEIEYHATVLNGTGYATNESNSQKAVAARLNSTVWQSETWGKLLLAVYGNAEGVGSSLDFGNSNNQGGLGVSYQHDAGRVFLEGLTGMKSNSYISGYSLGGVLSVGSLVEFLSGYNLFARVDSYVPNTNASNNERKKSFYGVTYDWGKDVKFSLDMQNAQTGSGAITSILYLHSMITL
jgi:hypothetical protein